MKDFKPNPNSFKNTFCIFQEVTPEAIVDLKPDFSSTSGSTYFYTKVGMFRYSNHWGRLANSKWRLVDNNLSENKKFKVGFANWYDFYPDNDFEKLYFLIYDTEKNTVLYNHKNNLKKESKAILRDTKETTKRIKQARNIATLNNWAKYLDYENLQDLRNYIINELITTNKSLEEIKSNYQKL